MTDATPATVTTVAQRPLDEIAAGDVLARELRDANGRFLLAKATKLTPELIGQLRRRGVDSVSVLVEIPAEAAEARRRCATERLDRRFRKVVDDPVMKQLHATLTAFRLRYLA
jgi:hypothetical protein